MTKEHANAWTPVDAGAIRLPHRLAIAPMTTDRSTPEGVPTGLNAEYYAQRASTDTYHYGAPYPSAIHLHERPGDGRAKT